MATDTPTASPVKAPSDLAACLDGLGRTRMPEDSDLLMVAGCLLMRLLLQPVQVLPWLAVMLDAAFAIGRWAMNRTTLWPCLEIASTVL